ncbi:MAG: hypothetical protein JNG89_11065, partial [Planctomycetaceae bacterium]|nr:hypothetical protein [Planctomycetaceae bacterium]
PALRSPALSWLYNNNPFYVISAMLMLFAVRSAYGELQIGYINSWGMMGVLAAYTALLSAIGVVIVRRGKVWEDARSIFVTVLLLFLAVSVSADDLFVSFDSPLAGVSLLFCGYVFCAVVTEFVLHGSRIRLSAWYRLPLHLLLALFYVAPWWCSPDLHPRSVDELEWAIFLFPLAAALLLLLLWPAARKGPALVAENGTPWGWPMFPWTAFAVIAAAVGLRTFALCMTFGPSGTIWIPVINKGLEISFDTMWGPYFLVPPVFSVLVLLLEGSIATGNRKLQQRLLWLAPILLLLLAIPVSDAPVSRGFLLRIVSTVGAPLWLSVGLLIAFYSLASLRRVSGAFAGLLLAVTLLSVVGPETTNLRTLTSPQPWPMVAVGMVLLVAGVRRRSSQLTTLACVGLSLALWLVLPATSLRDWQNMISLHVLGTAIVAISLAFKDEFSHVLRWLGAGLLPVAALAMLTTEVPPAFQFGYVVAIVLVCYTIAIRWKIRAYLYAFLTLVSLG